MQLAPESIAALAVTQPATHPIRSFAKQNRYLLEDFERYLVALGRSEATVRSYLNSVGRLIDVLGAKDAAELERSDIRRFQAELLEKGLTANSVRLHVGGIRAFAKFLRLAGLRPGTIPLFCSRIADFHRASRAS
jgi:CHAD domain-containing protein